MHGEEQEFGFTSKNFLYLSTNATIFFFIMKESFLGKKALIPFWEQRREVYDLVHPRLVLTFHDAARMG